MYNQDNQDVKHRDASLDAVGGMMIIYMIFGHIWTNSGLNDNHFRTALGFFLNCFMPWFFYKGGMFFRPILIRDLIRKDFRRLFIPFSVFSCFGIIVNFLCCGWGGVDFGKLVLYVLKYGSFAENAPLWFLISLAISRFCFNCILKFYKKSQIILCVLVLSLLSFYLFISYSSIIVPWYLANSMSGSLFLIAGYYLKDLQYKKEYVALSVLLVMFFLTKYECRVGMLNNELVAGDYLGWVISSIAMVMVLNNFFRFMVNITWMKYIITVGRHSMSYYCVHWPLITVVLSILSIFPNSNFSIRFIICCMACVLILPIADRLLHYKKMGFLIGEKV